MAALSPLVPSASSLGCVESTLLPSSCGTISRLLQVFVECRLRQEGGMETGEGWQRASSRVSAAPSTSSVEAVPI